VKNGFRREEGTIDIREKKGFTYSLRKKETPSQTEVPSKEEGGTPPIEKKKRRCCKTALF